MSVVNMKQLLESGVHFGHQTRRWNPKMADYIFTERNGIYIIDLQKTVTLIEKAYSFVKEMSTKGKVILFVGTKKQAQETVKVEAKRCEMPYINQRWLGGMLTNFKTIRERVLRLEKLEDMEKNGLFEVLPKKEVIMLRKEHDKLERFLGGIRDMKRIPDLIYITDPRKEAIAVAEAIKLNIPVVSIVDTNCDPDLIDYIIPGNDDAIRAVKLISRIIADAVLAGKQGEQLQEENETETQDKHQDEINQVIEEEPEQKVEDPESVKE